ncbi:MAG: beta-mannosidase [Actinomycetota bacterium]|nr:beta-mannosidase [Actinomycetota bacterium]
MHRTTARLMAAGQPVSWLGANFWSRAGGPLMWRTYDPALISAELRVLREHGLTMTRSFFYWPDFMPEPGAIDEEMTDRFADFLDRHVEQQMSTVPTFIVGHMSGQNWDPSWRAGRDLLTDVWLVGRQAWFAGEMVRRFGGHPAVAGWLASNEMPLYGGEHAPAETVAAWVQIIRDAVRAAGGHQPFSTGDGAWGVETSGRDNGFRLADMAGLCDFLGPHVYPVGDDRIRQHYAAAWQCELAGTFGLPVVLEEFGVSSDFASGPNAARYYRHVLHHSLLAGATGWIAWNNTDFDLPGQDPYRHHAFEQHFGLTDAVGVPKPALAELAAFAATLRAIGAVRCARAGTDTALIVPAYLDTGYPFTSPADAARLAATLAQAYVSARLADLAPAVTRESGGIAAGARLYLAPSVKQLLAPTAAALERLATDGACVYLSYSAGDTGWHRGPSYGRLDEAFGVRHQLDVGLVNPIEDEVAVLRLHRDFGGLTRGTTLSFAVAGDQHGRAFLPVEAAGAEVIATDAHGRPALLLRRLGRGSLVLGTYPVEHMAALTPGVNPDDAVTLYDALAAHAGVRRPVTVDDPRVACDTLVRDDGAAFAILASHAAETLTLKPVLAGDRALATLDGDGVLEGITLDPFGIGMFKVIASEPAAPAANGRP